MTRLLLPGAAVAHAVGLLRRDRRAVVLVDGRSGAGKSVLGATIARTARARLLRLDDVYPGWDGLDAAAAALVDGVLVPRRAGAPGLVRSWDWAADAAGPAVRVPVDGPLVVEGCGALSRRSAPLADLTLWLVLRDEERRRRALARDGAAYEPHWERWARQERRAAARESSLALADAVVDAGRAQPVLDRRPGDAQ